MLVITQLRAHMTHPNSLNEISFLSFFVANLALLFLSVDDVGGPKFHEGTLHLATFTEVQYEGISGSLEPELS